MKFKGFQIKRYRSIIDSGWNKLSNDGITVLIGQNESGKTSVLEALHNFYTGNITEDVLRSDNIMPEISCSFELSEQKFMQYLNEEKVTKSLLEQLHKLREITITRTWINLARNSISIGNEEIINYYEEKEEKHKKLEAQIALKVSHIFNTWRDINTSIDNLNQKTKELEEEIKEIVAGEKKLQKKLKRAKRQDDQTLYKSDLEKMRKKVDEINKELQEIDKERKIKEKEREKEERLAKHAEEFIAIQKLKEERFETYEKIFHELVQIENKYTTLYMGYVDKTSSLDDILKRYEVAKREYEQIIKKSFINLYTTKKILDGAGAEIAECEAIKECTEEEKVYTINELADELFKYIPVFEFFEDFSSLLPNRIDLKDLLELNVHTEGLKAAKNFLKIAGLSADFFEQKSNRLLKQKIENLNREITLDFQEYWRQSVGKDNKIELCFELEHYDYTHPEKTGKPYIEFWIKDKNERLYPKQRSRGVRWFLSFYLELKANTKDAPPPRIMLIDEPGLSLHARAQEDVLKVFEDIKDQIQIVYSTHSPHLIDIDKTFRLLAVQRAYEDEDGKGSVIMDAKTLTQASADTLSPIYTLMGTRLNDQQFIQKKNNVIVEDITTYYYYSTIFKMAGFKGELNFIPATNVNNVTTIANLLTGWKIDYIIVLDDNEEGKTVYNDLKTNYFHNIESMIKRRVMMTKSFWSVEDLFSTIDFKKHIVNQKIGITERNSEYIEENNLSRPLLAAHFMNAVQNNNLTIDSFDQETQENLNKVVKDILSMLRL